MDYIRYDVQQTASYYEVDVSLTYRVAPEELSQVISVTASTAVAGELQDLLPHRPQKVIFRIGYFTAEDSAETLRQAVEEAYDAQTIALPPLEEITVNLYPDSGQQRVAEILLTWGEGTHLRSAKFFGEFRKFPLTLPRQCDNIIFVDASVAHLVERHLAKVEVASSSLVTRSKKRGRPVGRPLFLVTCGLLDMLGRSESALRQGFGALPQNACGGVPTPSR